MVQSSKVFKRFSRDTRGAIAILTAILMLPVLLVAVGVPIDIGRQIQLRSNLQNITDTAALAASVLISQGATPAQACNMSNGYMTQQETDEGVATSSVATGTSFVSANGASTTTSTSTTPCPSAGAAITVSGAPYQVIAQATGIISTTFMSILQPSLTMTATSAVNGPLDFTTACVTPNVSGSSDIDTAYYYLVNTDGTRVNADEVTAVNENQPEYPDGSAPSSSGVDQAQELLDNQGNTNSVTLCPGSSSQYAIPIKIGLGERVAFEMTNQTGGKYPCNYATTWKASGTLRGSTTTYTAGSSFRGTPYPSNIILSNQCLSSGNTYTGTNGLTNFATNAYGSIVGTTNRFYSSDYPATLNTTNAITSLTYYSNTGNNAPSGDQTTTVATSNGYSAYYQSILMSTVGSFTVLQSQGFVPTPGGNIVWFDSSNNTSFNSSSNLVCLVQNGSAYSAPNPTIGPYKTATFTDAGSSGSPVTSAQAQPLAIATTSPSGAGSGVYKCADTTIASPADPYNANPTCSELNGATLTYSWDDMGGYYNNVMGYGDLTYTYSCTNTVSTYTTPALVQ